MVHTSMFAEDVGRDWQATEFAKERISFFRSVNMWLMASFIIAGIGGFIGLLDSVRLTIFGKDIIPFAAIAGATLLSVLTAFVFTLKKPVCAIALFLIPLLAGVILTSSVYTLAIEKQQTSATKKVSATPSDTTLAAMKDAEKEPAKKSGAVFLEFFIFSILGMISYLIYLRFLAKLTHSFWWSVLFSLPPIVLGLPILFFIAKAAWWEVLIGAGGAWIWVLFTIFDARRVWHRARRDEHMHSALNFYLDIFSVILILPMFLRRKPENERKVKRDIVVPTESNAGPRELRLN